MEPTTVNKVVRCAGAVVRSRSWWFCDHLGTASVQPCQGCTRPSDHESEGREAGWLIRNQQAARPNDILPRPQVSCGCNSLIECNLAKVEVTEEHLTLNQRVPGSVLNREVLLVVGARCRRPVFRLSERFLDLEEHLELFGGPQGDGKLGGQFRHTSVLAKKFDNVSPFQSVRLRLIRVFVWSEVGYTRSDLPSTFDCSFGGSPNFARSWSLVR